jgi:WD40 repeat protein
MSESRWRAHRKRLIIVWATVAATIVPGCGVIDALLPETGPGTPFLLWSVVPHHDPIASLALMAGGHAVVAMRSTSIGVIAGDGSERPLDARGYDYRSLDLHPGEAMVAAASMRGVEVIDIQTGEARLRFLGASNAVAWSPDGRWLAGSTAASADSPCACIHFWDAQALTLERSVPIPTGEPPLALAWSPDARRLYVAVQSGLHTLDASSSQYRDTKALDIQRRDKNVLPHPSLPLVALNAGKRIHVLDGVSLTVLTEIDVDGRVSAIDWHPRGDALLVLDASATLRTFDAAGAEIAAPLALPEGASHFRFRPEDGSVTVGRPQGDVVRIDGHTGLTVFETSRKPGEPTSVAFDRAGDRVATGGADGMVRIWNPQLTPGRVLAELWLGPGRVDSLAWSPDGQMLAAAMLGSDGDDYTWSVAVIDATTWSLVASMENERAQIAWLGADRLLISDLQRIQIRRGRTLDLIDEIRSWPHAGPALATPDGSSIVSVGYLRMTVWDSETLAPLRSFGSDLSFPRHIEASADGRFVAASHCSRVEVWALDTGERPLAFEFDGCVQSVVFVEDGDLVIATGGTGRGTVMQVWSLRRGELLDDRVVAPIAFHATWSADRGTVYLAGCARDLRAYAAVDYLQSFAAE